MGKTIAEQGRRGQLEQEDALWAVRGGPGQPRGRGDTAKCAGKEQASPASSVQSFAYIITGSVS